MHAQRNIIYFTASFFSIVLSLWACIRADIINPDAICYLQSAEAMKSGLNAAMHLCDQAKWPFYSILIFGLSRITTLSVTSSAWILDGIFSLISVIAFIRIIHFFKVPQRLLWFAALVILLAHEFNSVRLYIVRDHGFWAFYLLSVLSLLHFMRNPTWRSMIAWNVSLVLATLFRIEGLFFLAFLPFFAWLDFSRDWVTRCKMFLQLYSFILLGSVAVLIGAFLSHQGLSEVGRLGEVKYQMVHGLEIIGQRFQTNANALATHVLSPFSASDAADILFLMFIVWYVYCIAFNISLIYGFLVVYAWCRQLLKVENTARLVLWAYIAVNVMITAIFLVENMFLSKRYLMALSLILMMWVPFALNDLAEKTKKWPLFLAIFFIAITSLSGIFDFGYSKKYIREAGEWLVNEMPHDAEFYTNDYHVMYYSQHFGLAIFEKSSAFMNIDMIAQNKWKNYDYIALRFNRQEPIEIVSEMNLTPVKIFANKRGDQVSIYKIPHSSNRRPL